MPTGMSQSYVVDKQPQPLHQLNPDNSYFMVHLKGVQAYFGASWLTRPAYLAISSKVESSFNDASPIESLHQITTIKKNIPCQVGFRVNLTDWLPARQSDHLTVSLKYTVVRDTPFKDLVDKMDQVKLVARLSLLGPQMAAASKVSHITGKLLSFLLEEGSEKIIFDLVTDLNISKLQSGFFAIVGSPQNTRWPQSVWFRNGTELVDDNHLLPKLSYALLQVLSLPRLGVETVRGEAWWELLQTASDEALLATPINDQEIRQVLDTWHKSLLQVKQMARKNRALLLPEIQAIIQQAHQTVTNHYQHRTLEASSTLPTKLQDALGIESENQLQHSLRDYRDALDASVALLKAYDIDLEN